MNDLRVRLKPVLGSIAKRAVVAERDRQVPSESMEILREIGLLRALQPKGFGGLEVPVDQYAQCIVDLAEACASTAWACSLLATHSYAVALYDERAQEEVWGDDPDALVSSSVAPLGKWEAVDGGIRLSGRFGWSSGCDHATWAVLGYMGKNQMGQPGPCFALVPRHDYEILDDWDSVALRGTGSKSLLVNDAFVPEHRTESLFALNFALSRGAKAHETSYYSLPFSPIFSLGFSAVAAGIALRATVVFAEIAKKRVRAYTGIESKESATAQVRLAESTNQTSAALELLRSDWRLMAERARQGKLPPPDEVMTWRVQQSYATKMAIEAVDRLMAVAGGSAWFSGSEMQRLFRDVHICGAHAQTDYDIAAQAFGRHLLGLRPDGKHY